MASVLVVEDDEHVRRALVRELTVLGHSVNSAGRALDALRLVTSCPPEVVVLDLGLPDLDGAEVLKMLRAVSDVPVVVATARDGEREIIRLLRSGADDYLVKPFSAEHLHARLEAVLRRMRTKVRHEAITVGGLKVDVDRRQAVLDGAPLQLSRREFDLLAFLAANSGRVVRRRELLSEVWQQSFGDDQTIDVHVSWLRRKLGESAAAPRYLHTVRGVGLMLVEPSAGGPD
ncbi:DNA-binding response regulator [Actinomadura logoneensis]|uniref:DNA-binding response regulator n=1 Tax=Actinomadura logoneensis TaxID=2293572 RepID=A0A372J8N8_9ACTN|nr:response regulator transcription factor [Actinomadura logoneensis]RFU36365.1 DNA-binding response regulator [Actinomadura logoneensis]